MIKIIRSLGVGLWKIQGLPFSSSYCFATESEITRKANKLHQAMTNFPQRKSKTQEKPKKQSTPGTKPPPMTRGRAWKAEQLRIKSNEDLHKLWYVCVREKNLMLADKMLHKKLTGKKVFTSRLKRVGLTMARIMTVVQEREKIKQAYRMQLEEEYIERKRKDLQAEVEKQPQMPEVTWEILRAKYHDLRRGIDNIQYLQRIWQDENSKHERKKRAEERMKNSSQEQFKSFWEKEMTMDERPTQEEILRAHVKNWKSLNLKQRKIILGFLNARRAKDAKSAFVKELKILGQKIAYEEAKDRINSTKSE